MLKRILPAMSAFVLLSACGGGGGVNSPGSIPTPSPSPSPTPTPNVSLIGPLTSESFANDAVTGTASYPSSGANGTTSSAATALTVSYDASSQSYTINDAGRSQTFRPSDLSSTDSNAQIAVYKRSSSGTTDSLALTKPGTSGVLTYQYVGGGFWQRTTTNSSSTSGNFDAFAYGVKTPDSALPRTGSGVYSVDLLGVRAYADMPVAISGSGTISADFAGGNLVLRGTGRETNPVTGAVSSIPANWGGTARIASAGNSFSGTDFAYDTSRNGTVNGRFYGPSAQEVGAAFQVSANGLSTVGVLIGRNQSGAAPTGTTLVNATSPLTFAYTDETYYTYPGSGGQTLTALTYDPVTKRYADFSTGLSVDSSNKVAAESNARFTTYRSSDGIHTLKVYNAGPTNDQLVLYYSSFGADFYDRPQVGGSPVLQDTWMAFGLVTDGATMPRAGHAVYNGVLYGSAGQLGVLSGGDHISVSGTSQFDMDFGNATFSGLLTPTGTNDRTGATINFGNFTFGQTKITTDFARFNGSVFDAAGNQVGGVAGKFYGPYAPEIAGVFSINTQPPVAGSYTIAGAFGAKK